MRQRNVMLANVLTESRIARWEPPYIVQPKYDGHRAVAVVGKDDVTLLSATGRQITSVPHIAAALHKQTGGREVILDGELYCGSKFGALSFQRVASFVLSKWPAPGYEAVQYAAFDVISEDIQTERLTDLLDVLGECKPPIHIAPTLMCYSLDEALKLLGEWQCEGLILRNKNGLYVPRRSLDILKVKPTMTDVFTVVGFQEEIAKDGRAKGRLGALIVSDDEGRIFSVGSGLTDAEKEGCWAERDRLIHRRVTVRFQELSTHGIPRFPVFVGFKE